MEILDVKDNGPVFDQSVVQISLSESDDVASAFYVVHADAVDNGKLSYKLADSSPKGFYSIRAETWELFLSEKLDYESDSFYRNGHKPTFERGQAEDSSVIESTKVIIQLRATDENAGQNGRLTYRLVEDSAGGRLVDPISCVLY